MPTKQATDDPSGICRADSNVNSCGKCTTESECGNENVDQTFCLATGEKMCSLTLENGSCAGATGIVQSCNACDGNFGECFRKACEIGYKNNTYSFTGTNQDEFAKRLEPGHCLPPDYYDTASTEVPFSCLNYYKKYCKIV